MGLGRIFRNCLLSLFTLYLLSAIPSAGSAEEAKVALVIGNSRYEHVSQLPNTSNDAQDLSMALERIGFDVTQHFDLDYRDMRLAIRDFAEAAADADVVVVYFAGHGMEIDNTNYLIPVNAELKSDRDVDLEAIRLDTVIGAISHGQGLKIVLLDACRNNPFLTTMARTSATRSVGRGLARVDPGGVLVGYAARSGTLASDGYGRNSPYAQALLSHIEEPGLELGKMFRKVRDTVFDLTDGYQEPFTYGSLPGHDIFLVPASAPASPSNKDQTSLLNEQAASAWTDFRNSTSPEALESFAQTYPDTPYAALALSIAKRYRGAAVAPPEATPIPDLPEWCETPANEAQAYICTDAELLEMEAEVASLFQRRIEQVRGGAPRGQALIEQREWRLSRDACGNNAECIGQAYKLRRIALGEFSDGTPPAALIIRSVQEELNRLSCGAGEPDGVLGSRTRQAYSLAASLIPDLQAEAALDDQNTLLSLRNQPSAQCSYLARAKTEPGLLEGIWKVKTSTCPGEFTGLKDKRVRLRHEGNGVYSGGLAHENGAFKRAIGARLSDRTLSLTHVTGAGHRQSYVFEPGTAPDRFVGLDWSRCVLSISR